MHGGGFYHIQKYLVAPPNLPEDLTWFKWESYATWLSGFALMVLVYYGGAELYLIDARKNGAANLGGGGDFAGFSGRGVGVVSLALPGVDGAPDAVDVGAVCVTGGVIVGVLSGL